jgi:rod shape-determining protein MreD
MILEVIKHILRFLLLVGIQVLLLNNFRFNGFINPYLYILFVMMLPFAAPIPLVMLLSFVAGLTIDMFEDTMGLHASATLLIGYLRSYVLKLFSPREGYDMTAEPTLAYLGFAWYLSYSAIMVSLHHIVYFLIEAFQFTEIYQTLLRAFFSIIFTILLIFIYQMFIFNQKDRKLS